MREAGAGWPNAVNRVGRELNGTGKFSPQTSKHRKHTAGGDGSQQVLVASKCPGDTRGLVKCSKNRPHLPFSYPGWPFSSTSRGRISFNTELSKIHSQLKKKPSPSVANTSLKIWPTYW